MTPEIPLRVLLIADTEATTQGGVNQSVFSLGNELAKLGVERQYLFGADASATYATYLQGIPRAVRLYDPGIGALRLRHVLRSRQWNCTILHAHGSNAIFDLMLAAKLLPRMSARLLATLHGTDLGVLAALRSELRIGMEVWGTRQIGLLAHFYLAVAKERFAYRRLDGLAARSDGVAAESLKWFGAPARAITPGTDPSVFRPTEHPERRRETRERLGLADEDLAVLTVGKPAYRKGTRYLAEAIERVGAPFRLVTVGAEQDIGGVAARKLGNVPHAELPLLYAACDIFCLPSTYEAFGLVLLDAMAAGLACVAAPSAGGQAMISHEINGILVPKRDVEALVRAFKRLQAPMLRAQLGAAARKTASTLTWRREALETVEWYRESLATVAQTL